MTAITKSRAPAKYRAPLKTRKAILAFLSGRSYYSRIGDNQYYFCWNIKAYADLDFDHLLEVYRSELSERQLQDTQWLAQCREVYEKNKETLWNWAIEDAQENTTGGDTYRMLWDGTFVNVELGFHGRQGGWLCLESFRGARIERESDLEELDTKELRLLYRYVVQCNADFTQDAARQEVEYQAASTLFNNLCDECELTPLVEDCLGEGI